MELINKYLSSAEFKKKVMNIQKDFVKELKEEISKNVNILRDLVNFICNIGLLRNVIVIVEGNGISQTFLTVATPPVCISIYVITYIGVYIYINAAVSLDLVAGL